MNASSPPGAKPFFHASLPARYAALTNVRRVVFQGRLHGSDLPAENLLEAGVSYEVEPLAAGGGKDEVDSVRRKHPVESVRVDLRTSDHAYRDPVLESRRVDRRLPESCAFFGGHGVLRW